MSLQKVFHLNLILSLLALIGMGYLYMKIPASLGQEKIAQSYEKLKDSNDIDFLRSVSLDITKSYFSQYDSTNSLLKLMVILLFAWSIGYFVNAYHLFNLVKKQEGAKDEKN